MVVLTLFEIVAGVVLIVFSIAIVAVVLFQEGKEQSMGGVVTGGGTDSYLSKHKNRIIDAFLVRWTRVIAIALFVIIILLNISENFHWFGIN